MTQQIKPKYIKVGTQGSLMVGDTVGNGSSLPLGDVDKVLVSNGTTLEYQYPAIKVNKIVMNFNDVSPIDLGSPLIAGSRVQQIIVTVDTIFNGTNPEISIGIVGDEDQLATVSETNLKVAGRYTIFVSRDFPISDQIIVTYTSDGSTAGSATIELMYALP